MKAFFSNLVNGMSIEEWVAIVSQPITDFNESDFWQVIDLFVTTPEYFGALLAISSQQLIIPQ